MTNRHHANIHHALTASSGAFTCISILRMKRILVGGLWASTERERVLFSVPTMFVLHTAHVSEPVPERTPEPRLVIGAKATEHPKSKLAEVIQ